MIEDNQTITPGPSVWLTPGEVADRWRVSPRTLERWRMNGTGPVWLRLTGRVLYRVEDILRYERSHLQFPTVAVEDELVPRG